MYNRLISMFLPKTVGHTRLLRALFFVSISPALSHAQFNLGTITDSVNVLNLGLGYKF